MQPVQVQHRSTPVLLSFRTMAENPSHSLCGWLLTHSPQRFECELLSSDRGLIHKVSFAMNKDGHAPVIKLVNARTKMQFKTSLHLYSALDEVSKSDSINAVFSSCQLGLPCLRSPLASYPQKPGYASGDSISCSNYRFFGATRCLKGSRHLTECLSANLPE
jgi:hypothetical protein